MNKIRLATASMGLALVIAGFGYLVVQRNTQKISWYEPLVLMMIGVGLLWAVRKK